MNKNIQLYLGDCKDIMRKAKQLHRVFIKDMEMMAVLPSA